MERRLATASGPSRAALVARRAALAAAFAPAALRRLPHPSVAAGLARLRLGRRGRRAVAALAGVLLLAGGAWLWLRDSSLVAVRRVTVTGVTGPSADAIRSALADAARQMTTLHVQVSRLRAVVAPYGVVRGLRVSTDFPHGLHIRVDENPPVAALVLDGRRLPVTADGTILAGVPASSRLASVSISRAQAGTRLTDARGLACLAVMAAAPSSLRYEVTRVYFGSGGLTAQLRNGPALYFGDDTRLEAKWMAAARVLADAGSAGASYLDVRIPGRPVASVPGAQALLTHANAGIQPAGGVNAAGAAPASPAGPTTTAGAAGATRPATTGAPGASAAPTSGSAAPSAGAATPSAGSATPSAPASQAPATGG